MPVPSTRKPYQPYKMQQTIHLSTYPSRESSKLKPSSLIPPSHPDPPLPSQLQDISLQHPSEPPFLLSPS